MEVNEMHVDLPFYHIVEKKNEVKNLPFFALLVILPDKITESDI